MPKKGGEPNRERRGRDALLRACVEYFAANGIGDASLRQIAESVGSSHRMLIYHFGSREGLLAEVVEELEAGERELLAQIAGTDGTSLRDSAWLFWTHIADTCHVYGPLYFELSAHTMRKSPGTEPLGISNIQTWVDTLAHFWERAGFDSREAAVRARLNLATARGLVHDLLLTNDRSAVDEAMSMFDFLNFGDLLPQAPHSWASTGTGSSGRRGRVASAD